MHKNEVRYFIKFLSISLRGATLVSKFLLVFFLANYLEPAELGLYGLFVATVAYSAYPLGFDFYTYNTRELIVSDKKIWGSLLKNQGALHLILYCFFLPMYFLIFYFDFLPWYMLFWFYCLLVLEHVNQELMRLMIAISKQLPASLALFFRQGIWCLFIVVWMFFDAEARNLKSLLAAWSIGSALALLIAMRVVYKLPISGWALKIDWVWIKKGLRVAIPLFFATLSLAAISTFDKYWFSSLQGIDTLGAYVFFMSLAASLISFLEAGVFSFFYPTMIYAASKKNESLLKACMVKMAIQVTLFALLFTIVSYFFLGYVLEFIGKDIYLKHISLFYVLVFSMYIQSMSYIPHYALYAKHKDRHIVFSHFSSIFIFSIFVMILLFWDKLYSVPVALCLTYLVVLIWKAYAVKMYSEINLHEIKVNVES